MAEMPNFLAIIEDYRCINLSARAKQLKPAIDLVGADQQRSLAYILDVFPGLYCQRITAAGSQPRRTVSQPVLIVSFVPSLSQHTDYREMMDEQKRAQEPTVPRSNRPNNAENTTNNYRAPPAATAPSSHPHNLESAVVDEERPSLGMNYKAERYDQGDRDMRDSQVERGFHAHSQSSLHHAEGGGSRGGARESRRRRAPRPAPQNAGFWERLWPGASE